MAPRFVVRPDGEAWVALRRAVAELAELVGREEVDMNALGHTLSACVTSARAAFEQASLPSLRLEAASRALDLKTPKSALEAFIAPSPTKAP